MASKKRGVTGDDDDDRTARDGDEANDAAIADDLDELDDFGDDRDAERVSSGRRRASSGVAVTRPRAEARSKTDEERPGIFARIVRFIREVVAELQKVIWPTRKELLTYTAVVVFFVALMMALVALLDLGFARAMLIVFGGATDTATDTAADN